MDAVYHPVGGSKTLLAHLTNLGLNTCSFRWRSDISFMVLFRGSWSRSSGVQWTMGSSRAVARRPGLSMSEIRMLVKEPTLSLKFREGESPTRTTMPCLSISSPTLWKGERSHLYILIQPTVLFLASCQEKLSTYLDCRTEELLDITAQRCGTRLRAPTKSCFGRARYSLRASSWFNPSERPSLVFRRFPKTLRLSVTASAGYGL
mmetsp:Transcript_32863/g.77923  ORF Transcript_32863/g.77923 Transcript_32863/m.77923 type:complete len:205 (+) Transcript_32863:253-867(+)